MTMQTYCKIVDGIIVAKERKDPGYIKIGSDGNPIWRPFIKEDKPVINGLIETATKQTVIEPTQVRETWVVTPKSLSLVKSTLKQKGNAHRRTLERSNFAYNASQFQSDQYSINRIHGEYAFAIDEGASYSGVWKAADNTMVTLDLDGITGLFRAMRTHFLGAFHTIDRLKSDIDAAATVQEAIDAYNAVVNP